MNRGLKIPGFTWVVVSQFVDIGQFFCRSSNVNLGRFMSKLNYFLIYVVLTLYIFLNQFVINLITTNQLTHAALALKLCFHVNGHKHNERATSVNTGFVGKSFCPALVFTLLNCPFTFFFFF